MVNSDDVHGRLLLDAASIPMTPFSHTDIDDLVVTPTSHEYSWRGQHVTVGIGGAFNAMNSLAAATAAAALGVQPNVIAAGLRDAPPVPGRFEPVRAGQPFSAAALDADLTQIEELYRRIGYASARAEATTTPEPARSSRKPSQSATPDRPSWRGMPS